MSQKINVQNTQRAKKLNRKKTTKQPSNDGLQSEAESSQ